MYALIKHYITILVVPLTYMALSSPRTRVVSAYKAKIAAKKLSDPESNEAEILPELPRNQLGAMVRFETDPWTQRWLALHRTILTLMALVEAYRSLTILFPGHFPSNIFTEPESFCPQDQGPMALITKILFPSVFGFLNLVHGHWDRVRTYKALDMIATSEATTPPTQHKVITTEPYSNVRHPAYKGLFSIFWGIVPLRLDSNTPLLACGLYDRYPSVIHLLGVWVISCIWCMYWLFFVRAKAEDKELKEAFGEEGEAYCKDIPMLSGIFRKKRTDTANDTTEQVASAVRRALPDDTEMQVIRSASIHEFA